MTFHLNNHTHSHTDTPSLSHTQQQQTLSLVQPVLSGFCAPQFLLSSATAPSKKQTNKQPNSSHTGNNTSSPARPGTVGPLTLGHLDAYYATNHRAQSFNQYCTRSTVCFIQGGKRERRTKRELRSHIRAPTRQAPVLPLSPNLAGRPNHKYPDCLGLPGQSSRHDPQSRATPHSQPRYSVTSTLTFPEPLSPSLRFRASLIRYAHAHAQPVAVDANAGCALSILTRPRHRTCHRLYLPKICPRFCSSTASWHRTTGPSRQHSLPSPPPPPPPRHHHHPRNRNSSDDPPQPHHRPRLQSPAPVISIRHPSRGRATNHPPRPSHPPLAASPANIPQPKSPALASQRRCLRRSDSPASLRSRRSDAVGRRRRRGATRLA